MSWRVQCQRTWTAGIRNMVVLLLLFFNLTPFCVSATNASFGVHSCCVENQLKFDTIELHTAVPSSKNTPESPPPPSPQNKNKQKYRRKALRAGKQTLLANSVFVWLSTCRFSISRLCGLTFTWWECCGLCFWLKPTELAHSFFFLCSCVCFCLYGLSTVFPSTDSPDNSPLSHSILPVLFLCLIDPCNYICLCMKASSSPDIILCGWLGLKHQLTN